MAGTNIDPVTAALLAAIERADSPDLRLGLATHLLKSGNASDALAQAEAGLRLDAAHTGMLAIAADAAEGAGEAGKAEAYRLAAQAAPRSIPAVPPAQPVASEPARPRRDEDGAQDVPRLRLVGADDTEEETPTLRLADVGGMEEVKKRLARAFLQPIKNPEVYRKFGKRIGGGLVLYGPPGCGKTFIARAIAGEIGARFMNVGLNDVLDMYVGESERRLHELFETARRRAPTVLFFDEIDALGQRRTNLKHSGTARNVVNQLLSELDGIGGKAEELFVLGATNHPWDLDPALRRPGRFDRLVFVPPPDAPARKEILALKLREKPVGTIDYAAFANATDGFSGADLAALVDAAMDLAIERSVDSGREVPIDGNLLKAALRDQRQSIRPWFETARNYALYSNEGGTYDDLLEYLRKVGLS